MTVETHREESLLYCLLHNVHEGVYHIQQQEAKPIFDVNKILCDFS